MKKDVRFMDLSETAQEEALRQVVLFEKNGHMVYEYSHMKLEGIVEKIFLTHHLVINDFDFDLSKSHMPVKYRIYPTEEFYRRYLDDDLFAAYKGLQSIYTKDLMTEFQEKETGNFAFSMTCPEPDVLFHVAEDIPFIMKYATNAELKNRYRLIVLLLDDEAVTIDYEQLALDFHQVATEQVQRIVKTIQPLVAPIWREAETRVRAEVEKYHTEDYCRNVMKMEHSYKGNIYRFDENGNVRTWNSKGVLRKMNEYLKTEALKSTCKESAC